MSLPNPRYERFAQGLAEGKPAYQAYIDAGFAKAGAAQSASRLLKSQRAGIRERVAEILQEREQIDAEGTKLAIERTAIDKEWVIERLRENVERAMQARPVIDRAGNPTGSYVYNGAAANRALELLGKELGMFIERRENKIVDEFDSMTDKQIEAWLDERAEARVKARQLRESPDVRRRMHRGRMPAGSVGTLGPTTAQGKPH
jgi:phage terminase small subunit